MDDPRDFFDDCILECDCRNCKLRKFLETLGTKDAISEDGCFVLCTEENKKYIDALFGYYLEHLFENNLGHILYDGKTKDMKGRIRS